jgi:hypothetical protein
MKIGKTAIYVGHHYVAQTPFTPAAKNRPLCWSYIQQFRQSVKSDSYRIRLNKVNQFEIGIDAMAKNLRASVRSVLDKVQICVSILKRSPLRGSNPVLACG